MDFDAGGEAEHLAQAAPKLYLDNKGYAAGESCKGEGRDQKEGSRIQATCTQAAS